jgi:hypothetical protein
MTVHYSRRDLDATIDEALRLVSLAWARDSLKLLVKLRPDDNEYRDKLVRAEARLNNAEQDARRGLLTYDQIRRAIEVGSLRE